MLANFYSARNAVVLVVILASGTLLSPRAQANTPDNVTEHAAEPAIPNDPLAYYIWDQTLKRIVVETGRSTRYRLQNESGFYFHHKSPFRLEGNRIVFARFDDKWKQIMRENVKILQKTGNEIDLSQLTKDEQLAFWINLHNAAMIDLITQNYPIRTPNKADTEFVPMQARKVLQIKGEALSPRDIREKIVYPNWTDPKVIYGFFVGDISSPSIQPRAFTGDNVNLLLQENAEEYVNSLRGLHKWDDEIRISRLYEDVKNIYFPNPNALLTHFRTYAEARTLEDMNASGPIVTAKYHYTVADLSGGVTYRPEDAIKIFTTQLRRKEKRRDRQEKLDSQDQKNKTGTVTIEDIETTDTNKDE